MSLVYCVVQSAIPGTKRAFSDSRSQLWKRFSSKENCLLVFIHHISKVNPYVKYLISAKLQVRQPLQHLLFKQSKNKSHASMFSLKYLILPLEFIAKSKAKATLKKLKTNAPSLSLNDVIADTNPDIYICNQPFSLRVFLSRCAIYAR